MPAAPSAALPAAVSPLGRGGTGVPSLEVRDLVKVFGGGSGPGRQPEVRAVDGISFTVDEGEFFGLLGPNGAGKTTAIKIVTTLLARTSGRVRVLGHDLDEEGNEIRRLIGYTGQSAGVDGELTGRENLMLMGHLYHLPTPLIRQRVDELLELLQLTEAADREAYTYSGGMRRRLDLGSGLVHHPRLLFLDEPTTGLDPQTRNAVWEYLRRLHRDEGITIFLTTQYMEEADQLCERLAIIDHGKLVAAGTPAQLKAEVGADAVTIRLPRDAAFEATQARALALVAKALGVLEASRIDEGVVARARNGGSALIEILRLLETEKIPVNEVAVAHPTLDQVFLKHTGRAMRVEEVRPASRMGWTNRRR